MVAVAWVVFAFVVLGTLAFSYAFVKYYSDKQESEWLPTLVATTGIALTFFALFVIPVDIYALQTFDDLDQAAIEQRQFNIKTMYYALYGMILVFSFGIIPFAYFYYEEEDDEIKQSERIGRAGKFTVFTVLVGVILLVIGRILFTGSSPVDPSVQGNAKRWIHDLMQDMTGGDAMILFLMSVVSLLGSATFLSYTSVGVSAMPIRMMKGTQNLMGEKDAIDTDLSITSEKRKALENKWQLSGKTPSRAEERQLADLRQRESLLAGKSMRLRTQRDSLWTKVSACLAPFTMLFGFLFFLVSVFLLVSMSITIVDKATNSLCGLSCGFVLKDFGPNPFDRMIVELHKAFPIDYLVFIGMIFFFFFTTIAGIVRVGIRILWLELFPFRAGATAPQGLLLSCYFLMYTLLTINFQLLTIAPQYATWGTQKYEGKPCSVHAPLNTCYATQISDIVNRITISSPFFALVFFGTSILFVIIAAGVAVVTLLRRKDSNLAALEDDDDI